VIVGQEVTAAPTDVQRLAPTLEAVKAETGRYPTQLSADSGYASEGNLLVCEEHGVDAYVALRRLKHDEALAPAPALDSRLPPASRPRAVVAGSGCRLR